MTSEKRFIRIENLFSTLTEHQVQHAYEIAELREMQKGVVVVIGKAAETQRAIADRQQAMAEKQQALSEAQLVTEQKLAALIDIVDRIIRRQPAPSA